MTWREQLKRWPPAWREWWAERAAIRFYDGKQGEEEAEVEAFNDARRYFGSGR